MTDPELEKEKGRIDKELEESHNIGHLGEKKQPNSILKKT